MRSHICDIRPQKCDKLTLALRKPGITHVFDKNSPAKKFRPPKHSTPVNYELLIHQSNEEIDPKNAFVEKEKKSVNVKKGNGQWGMLNLLKTFKNSAFSDQNWPKKWREKQQHTTQLNDAPSISANTWAFPSLKTGLKNIAFAL